MSEGSAAGSADAQRAKTFFDYGTDATRKSNFDYAISMFRQACKIVPDNMVFRQSLRGVERKKFKNDPKAVGKLVGMRNQPILMQAKSARSKGKFHEALELCEDAFANNPWDLGAARVAAEAAQGLELGALSQWFVESVIGQAGKDVDFFRFAAEVFRNNESWAKAIATWEQVKKLAPNDQEVNRKINELSAASTIRRAGLDEAMEEREEAEEEAPAETESQEAKLERLKQEQLTPKQRLLEEIKKDPTAVNAYINLADLFRQHGDLETAEKILFKGVKANPTDPALKTIHEDTQIARLKLAHEHQTARVQEMPEDTGAKVKLDELTKMLNKYQVDAFRRRVNLNPEDASLHFEFGQILMGVEAYDEAIAEFQAARSTADPSLKIQALYQAGLAFEAVNAPKLAERNYKEALKLLDDDDKENFNALNYQLGRVSESQGEHDAARDFYSEVAANDYTYRDVAQRLRSLI